MTSYELASSPLTVSGMVDMNNMYDVMSLPHTSGTHGHRFGPNVLHAMATSTSERLRGPHATLSPAIKAFGSARCEAYSARHHGHSAQLRPAERGLAVHIAKLCHRCSVHRYFPALIACVAHAIEVAFSYQY